MTQIVIEDDKFISDLFEAMEHQKMPVWNFQGTLLGRNGSEERVTYREVIGSDVIKRNWSFFVNRPPKLQSN